MTKIIRAFVAGSAFPVVSIPFLLLTTVSFARNINYLSWGALVWIFPILLGIVNVIFWQIEGHFKQNYTKKLWIAGFLLGIIMPSLGIINNIPHNVFGLPSNAQYFIYIGAIPFYMLVWRYAIGYMNKLLSLSSK